MPATAFNTPPPGQTLASSHGMTHYQVDGPSDGAPVLLVHGLASWSFAWDPLVPALVQLGRRVIRLDLYGRGYSARPHARHTPELYVTQILELLDGLGLSRPVDVVGWSMGGAVSVALCDQAPERVGKLALMAPAGLAAKGRMTVALIKVPGFGELMSLSLAQRAMRRGVTQNFANPERAQEYLAGARRSLERPGYRRSILSCLRHFPFHGGLEAAYRRVGAQERPIRLLWGTLDQLVPYAAHRRALELLPRAELVPLEGLAHACHWEKVEPVASALTAFLGTA
jgi:pimeloyl-ACP methyl ester carboxylesterase